MILVTLRLWGGDPSTSQTGHRGFACEPDEEAELRVFVNHGSGDIMYYE